MTPVLDTLLDRTILLGYSRPGYLLRRGSWPDAAGLPRLEGRQIAITGATSGLGRATATGLYELGASLVLLVRSRERGEALAGEIRSGDGHDDRIRVVVCDLSDLSSVRAAAEEMLSSGERIDGLVNNAGVMSAERVLSPDGIELTFATNVVGPFLLTNLLEPALAAAPAGRVINVSSGGMYGQRIQIDDLQNAHDYNGITAYARSKRAEVILTGLWARRWRSQGIAVHAMHPGWADTEGVRDSMPTFHRLTKPILRTPAQGADTTVWLAAANPQTLGTGGFWHDRRRRPTHLTGRTRESEQDRADLWNELCRLSGWSDPLRPAGAVSGAAGTAGTG